MMRRQISNVKKSLIKALSFFKNYIQTILLILGMVFIMVGCFWDFGVGTGMIITGGLITALAFIINYDMKGGD